MKRSDKFFFTVIAALLLAFAFFFIKQRKDNVSKLCINEVLPVSDSMIADKTSIYEEWIEIYNGSDQTYDLSDYGLSDRMDTPYRWRFPKNTQLDSGNYLLVYTTDGFGDAKSLHASFGLNKDGETLVLTDEKGKTVDTFSYGTAFSNLSYGRIGADGNIAILKKMTPGKENKSSISKYYKDSTLQRTVLFSKEAGCYEQEFELALSSPEGGVIYYTTDSSDPDLNSKVYRKPISISDRSGKPNRFASKKACADKTIFTYRGQDPVEKATIVKARVCKDGVLADNIETRTYFATQEKQVMRISLTAEPDDLFGDENGIYVPGNVFRYYIYTRPNEIRNKPLGNFSVTGKAGERKASAEFFSSSGRFLFRQEIGLRISGGLGNSAEAAKPLRLYASIAKNKSSFDFPYFTYNETDQTLFQQLQLRSNPKFYEGIFEDVFSTTLFLGEDMGVQAYEPAELYINGEYWGLAAVRERVNEQFIESHFSIKPDNLVMLKSSHDEEEKMALVFGEEEDRQDYLELFEYAASHDMTLDENYRYIADRIDIDSFIKCYLAHIFCANRDWPDNNLRVFRSKKTETSQFEDGKWRYLLYDMDFSFLDYEHKTLQFALGEEERGYGWDGDEYPDSWSIKLFVGLMNNKWFRQQFLAQYEHYRGTIFRPEYLKERLDQMLIPIKPLIENHAERWIKKTDSKKIGSRLRILLAGDYYERENIIAMEESMYEFAENRRDILDMHMREVYQNYKERIPDGR